MALDEELLAILACPQCKGQVRLSSDGGALDCPCCRLRYEIRNGIPVMLIDEARRLDGETPHAAGS
jgi:hypothetical protein